MITKLREDRRESTSISLADYLKELVTYSKRQWSTSRTSVTSNERSGSDTLASDRTCVGQCINSAEVLGASRTTYALALIMTPLPEELFSVPSPGLLALV
jgi:hypothetical protein